MSEPNPIRAALIAAGLLSKTGDVAGADESHPDAELLALIAERSAEQRASDKACAEAFWLDDDDDPGAERASRLMREAMAAQHRADKLDGDIASVPATTREAAIAKLVCALDAMNPDPRAHNEFKAFLVSAMRDALRFLEGDLPSN